MSETLLKKTFQKKDVERLRNLIKGKQGDKISVGVGYNKLTSTVVHKEGDVWEESGRKWTIKQGIKQNVTKLDKVKSLSLTPLFCPQCSKPMNKPFDKDYFNIHKKCFNCVVDFETELKRIGAWEEYHKNIHNSEIDNFIESFKLWVTDELTNANDSFIAENGDIENWVGGIDKSRVLESLDNTIEYLNNLKK